MSRAVSDLRLFQLTVAKTLTGLGVVHVPILAVICALLDRDVTANTIACAAFAMIPVALLYAGRPITIVSFGLAITLVGQTSLLVQSRCIFITSPFSPCCRVFATGACWRLLPSS
jgi:hypothetical protein